MTTFERETIDKFLKENHNAEIKHIFDIEPISAPRMTKSDQWKIDPNHKDPKKRQRKCVTQYFAYKNALQLNIKRVGFKLPEVLRVIFVIPMSESWTRTKKEEMKAKFHKQKPDIDNLIKAFMDSYGIDDSIVSGVNAYKVWGYEGKVIIF